MNAAVHQPTGRPAGDAAPLLAADVGGTHVRIGLVRAGGAPGTRRVQVLHYRKYACADYASLTDIVADFVAALDAPRADALVIASAGYVLDDGTLIANNLPWPVSLRELGARLGVRDCRLVNDFVAVAHAAGDIAGSEVLHLAGPEAAQPGPVLVVGPGTGLGAAVRIPTAYGPVVLATEAGQAALAPSTETEIAIFRLMRGAGAHVPVEGAVSGPGLMRLYTALGALRGGPAPACTTPGEVSTAAQSGRDPIAREALDLFCGLLGSTVGDMALMYGVQGGIYLAGGILPQIREFLLRSSFVERFLDKGAMREALVRVPVKLVEHGQLGVVGAAHWYLDTTAAAAAPRNEDTPAATDAAQRARDAHS